MIAALMEAQNAAVRTTKRSIEAIREKYLLY
jgi:hypothetical protein